MKAVFRSFGAIFISCVLITSALAAQQKGKGPDRVKSTKEITAKLVSFELGDYVHAVVKDAKGKEESYFVSGPEVEYFLAAHPKKMARLKVRTIDTFVEEAGQRMDIDKIVAASIGKLSAKAWWARQIRGKKVSAVFDRYEKVVQALAAKGGRSMRFAPRAVGTSGTPRVLALNAWVLGVRSGRVWKEGTSGLNGQRLRFSTFSGNRVGRPVTATLEYTDDAPAPSLILKGDVITTPPTLYASGDDVTFMKLARVSPRDRAAMSMARTYAKSKGRAGMPVVIQDGVVADFNGDGRKETLLAVSSGSSLASKKAKDYSALILAVGGQSKVVELDYQSQFGEQRGPFAGSIVAAGNLDGGRKPIIVVSSEDPWGHRVWMLQLSKAGKVSRIWSAANGE